MAAAALILAACTTDLTSPAGHQTGQPISFTVTTDNSTTRSNLQSQPLTGYSQKLWLVPLVTGRDASHDNTNVTTRGTQLTSESVLPSFGISAFLHPQAQDVSTYTPDYFYNLQALRNAETGKYTVSQDYYWPADNERLTFYAYAPYGNNNAVLSTQATAGPQKIAFTVASAVTDQIDLLTATALNQTPSTTQTPSVSLQFHHELTGVRFVIGDQFLKGWIKSITLKNVYGRGTKTIGGSWLLSDDDKTSFSVTYNTDRPVTGASGQAVTADNETFLMIPQTLGADGQEVEIVYQDEAHNDYTVKAPLTGTWQAGQTVTYTISSTDLTTLRISSISFPAISGAPKTGWANGDQVGMYVVGADGQTLIHKNILVTYTDGAWTISHPAAANIYDLPGQTYFLYYPYSDTSSGQPLGYPEAATSADETADDFFANVVTQHPIATDQSQYTDFVNSDLCIAKATATTTASTISATLSRKVGLAFISLGSATANKSITFTNGVAGTPTTASVTASSTFSGNIPYNNSTSYCAYVKANTATSFSSATYSSTNKDAWEASLVFTIAAGESDSKTAYSDRKNWEYVNAIWNYEYSGKVKKFTTPVTEVYTIQCWGAQGGGAKGNGNVWSNTWGLGGYTIGDINLTADDELFVCVGGKGTDGVINSNVNGGWNGGGRGSCDDGDDDAAGGGGGATDIRLDATAESTTWNTFSSLLSRIMVAAGGGGLAWSPNFSGQNGYGSYPGYGGGLSGGNAYRSTSTYAQGATQEAGGGFGFGQDGVDNYGNVGMGGGGSGYFGGRTSSGTSTTNTNSASGGSSFISGLTGCQAYESTSTSSNMVKRTGDNATIHYSGKVFTNASTIAGNTSQTQPDGTSTTGHTGNGYARITLTRW